MEGVTMLMKYLYTVFLGLLIAVFVGVGISVFYERPAEPTCYSDINYSAEETKAIQEKEQVCNTTYDEYYENELSPYNRNISVVIVVFAVLLVALGIALESRTKVISDSVVLSGVFTLIYGIGRSFAADNTKYTFAVVAVGLAVALYLGFRKFVEPREKSAKKPTAKTTKKSK